VRQFWDWVNFRGRLSELMATMEWREEVRSEGAQKCEEENELPVEKRLGEGVVLG
jgi:hypothetical protein